MPININSAVFSIFEPEMKCHRNYLVNQSTHSFIVKSDLLVEMMLEFN